MPTSTEDRFSRGLRATALVLGCVVLSGAAFGSAVEAFGWLTGIVEPPAVVRIYRRGPDDLVEYSAGVAWRFLLVGLFSGVFFAAGTLIAACLTVGIFRRAGRKAGLTRQWGRHAGRSSSTECRPGVPPEPKSDPPPQRVTYPFAITSRDARTRGRLQVYAPLELVAEAAGRAVKHLSRFTLVELSSSRALFTARRNWKTWGLRITLTFTRDDSGGTIIDALSEPQVEATLMDYGQGKNDLRALLAFIDQQLSNPRPPSGPS